MKEEDKHSKNFQRLLENQDIYECEHQNKIARKIESNYTIIVCNKCFNEFTNHETRPLSLAKQILSLSNKMIENTSTFMDGKGLDKSLNLWHNCNNDVLEQLKKLNFSKEDKNNQSDVVEDETNYNFDEILQETELTNNETELDGKNLHDLYRHSTKLIK
ncbi:MAG: hypothetical protein NZ747_00180 [Nitrosopumilus sp.]|nr:hypothetical protein [Nitrosopumilus sp.]